MPTPSELNQWLDRVWRLFATGFSFALFGLGGIVIGLFFLILVYPLPINKQTKQGWTRASISIAMACYVRIMRSLGLLRFELNAKDNLYANGQLVIANHPSLLDVVFLISMLRDTNCIVKGSLWRNPFTFAPVRLAGYLRNDSDTLLDDAAGVIKQGQRLIIFPEGTRNQSDTTLDFKRGAANIAVIANCPITPVLIKCSPRTLQKNESWHSIPEQPPLFRFKVLDSISIDKHIQTDIPKTRQVRQLNRHIIELFKTELPKL